MASASATLDQSSQPSTTAEAPEEVTQGVNPWIIALRHARHLHGGARHRHRLRRAALHRRLALGLQRRGHLGAHQLPRRQRRHPPGQQLVLPPLRTQALSHHLRQHLHRRLLLLRSRAHSRLYSARRASSRAPAAAHSSRSPRPSCWKASRRKARRGHGRLRLRRRRRARARPHARRLAHRHLQLALRLLHQHSHRHHGRLHDQPLRPRSAVHHQGQGRTFDNIGFGTPRRLDRLPPGHPR